MPPYITFTALCMLSIASGRADQEYAPTGLDLRCGELFRKVLENYYGHREEWRLAESSCRNNQGARMAALKWYRETVELALDYLHPLPNPREETCTQEKTQFLKRWENVWEVLLQEEDRLRNFLPAFRQNPHYQRLTQEIQSEFGHLRAEVGKMRCQN